MSGIYSIGVSGLQAAQMGLLATEHNISNSSTPGYNRQHIIQGTNIALNTGGGAIGQGVHVSTMERAYDRFLSEQVNIAQTNVSELTTFYDQISQVNNMLADPSAGLSPALQEFFRASQQVASNPSSMPARQSMVSNAQVMVDRFKGLDTRLTEIGNQVNGRITDAVAGVNSYSTQIADMNQRIIVAQAGYGQPPNDLLDARDQLIAELNKLIKVTTYPNANGSMNVSIAKGQPLVVGSVATQLTSSMSTADPQKMAVGVKTPGGSMELPESLIEGGELGGLVTFRNQALDSTRNDLGRIAASFALTFNAQHSLGQDLLGNVTGGAGFRDNMFTLSGPTVLASTLNTGAGAMTAVLAAPTAPTAPTYSRNFSTNLQASDYEVTFAAAGAWTVTRLSDGVGVAAGAGVAAATFDGVTMNITAVGANGDKFQIQPVRYMARNIGVDIQIAADARLVAAAAPMKVDPTLSNQGTMKIGQGLVGQGYSTAALPLTLTATAATLGGFPAGTATAIYADGTTVAAAGASVNLLNGTATLSGVSFQGMYFTMSGTPAAGDTFVVSRNNGGVQDGRNLVLLGKLQTQNTTNNGTATYQSTYAQLVANNGVYTHQAQVKNDAQQSLLNQSTGLRNANSGVNLDEEAANLITYQQAYQAAAKSIQIASSLFDSILAIAR